MNDVVHSFGGTWTDEKLRRLSAYLTAYNTALKKQPFRRLYIDAFAGTGTRAPKQAKTKSRVVPEGFWRQPSSDARGETKGSAQLALEAEPPFHEYIFIEKSARKLAALRKLKGQYPLLAGVIQLIHSDANEAIKGLCRSTNWSSSRAVLFLDPYGMQVDWATLEAIAKTEAVDLWYLVPLGMGIMRLTKRDGKIPPKWRDRLNRMLGDDTWFKTIYTEHKALSFFDPEPRTITSKRGTVPIIEAYLVRRLKTIFPWVAEHGLVLRNSRNHPMFILMFACANKKGGPIAMRIAEHILGQRGAYRGNVGH